MQHDDKRAYRKLKKIVKRTGTKRARRGLKQTLRDDPTQAHEADVDHGRCESATMNGNDGRNRKRSSDD